MNIQSHLAPDLTPVKGSPVHLFKTVMNLVSNAAEAMPDGGTLSIQTENRTMEGSMGDHGAAPEGNYAVLIVQDNGTGIFKEDLARIFEPFYSKKVMGKSGTGLGMAVVWGTVKDHGGFIDTQSREGVGTTFSLYFPATREVPKAASVPWSLVDQQGHGQAILIVDDVAEQREITTAMLTKLGYWTEAVSSEEAAVGHVAQQSVDLLLLDMVMDPGIDGLETYRRILEIHLGQKAVVASGYAESARIRKAQRIGPVVYLKKTYGLDTLAEAVGAALADEPRK